MGKRHWSAAVFALTLIATAGNTEPVINPLGDGSFSVTTGDCMVQFTAEGRVLGYGETCGRDQIGEANAALRRYRQRQEEPAIPRPARPGMRGLQIHAVQYGADNQACDATPAFERACRGQSSCEVPIDNALCGDPASGQRKFALVDFSCHGQQQQKLIEEGGTARLDCAASPGRPAPLPSSTPTLRVEEAVYGAGSRTCEAGPAFARACNGQRACEVTVDNGLCGDPARGERKSVRIDYRCGDRALGLTVDEGDVARLDCAGGAPRPGRPGRAGRELRIEDVAYGAGRRTCDASRAFAAACNGRRSCEVTVDNELCGDPARGQRKSAGIDFRCGDRSLRFDADEGDRVRLDCTGGSVIGGGAGGGALDIRIEDVVYGFGTQRCDATRAFAGACNGRPDCAVRVDNELCGDPAPGTPKRADIEYRCGDRSMTLSVDEGATANLSCR